jgi:hypothetical protein
MTSQVAHIHVRETLVGTTLARVSVASGSAVDLAGRRLAYASLAGWCLARADVSGAYLLGADLKGAQLAQCNARHSVLVGADLAGANLAGARLDGANLAASNLAGARLEGASLTGATYSDSTVWPIGVDPQSVGAIRLAGGDAAGEALGWAREGWRAVYRSRQLLARVRLLNRAATVLVLVGWLAAGGILVWMAGELW